MRSRLRILVALALLAPIAASPLTPSAVVAAALEAALHSGDEPEAPAPSQAAPTNRTPKAGMRLAREGNLAPAPLVLPQRLVTTILPAPPQRLAPPPPLEIPLSREATGPPRPRGPPAASFVS